MLMGNVHVCGRCFIKLKLMSTILTGRKIESEPESYKALKVLMDPIYKECVGIFSSSSYLKKLLGLHDAAVIYQKARISFVRNHVEVDNNNQGFVGGFFNKMKSSIPAESDYFKQDQLTKYLTDLFLAGTDSMATTVAWALVLLASNPKRQKRLQKEIDNVVIKNVPSMAQYDTMHYTRATMQEVFRMRPVFPLSIEHQSTRDTIVMGCNIPNNTVVVANLWAVHNDAKYWKNPDKFYPERHLNENGECIKSEKIIPFSTGPRYCLGGQLATMHLFLFMVNLLQKFTFDLAGDYNEEQLRGMTSIVLAPRGIKLSAKAR